MLVRDTLAQIRPGFMGMHSFGRLVTRMASIQLWAAGFLFCLVGGGRRWKTLVGPCPVPVLRVFDAPGQGLRSACGLISRLPLLRPVALYTLDMGMDRKGHQVRARLRGLAAPHKGGKKARPASGMEPLAGVVCPNLPVRPGARGRSAPDFFERSGYRESLGAGPIRPLFRYKKRLLR